MRGSLLVVVLGIFLIVGSLWLHGKLFDVQLYNTYFIVGWSIMLLILGLACCLSGGVAFLLASKRVRRLR